ncbi:MAG TPA: hypothetical protein VFG50_00985 [Rhodothermales bacterium]|nr:hypothetical protein [Rhodothermales bacterium]
MKRLASLLLGVVVLLTAQAASAQSVTQNVTLSFPSLSAIALSSNSPLTLTINSGDAATGTWQTATNAGTTLYQLNNYGTSAAPLKIQAQFSQNLSATGLALSVAAAGAGGQTANLSDGTAHDIVRGIQRGMSSHVLTYSLSAANTAVATTISNATITYTITAQ